jgi:hypothetical protein
VEITTFLDFAGCELQNFVFPKKWDSERGATASEQRFDDAAPFATLTAHAANRSPSAYLVFNQ